MNFLRITAIIFVFCSSIFAQQSGLIKQRKDLNKIRSEIEIFEKKLQNESVKEANILDILSNLDHEIDLINGLLKQLKKEEVKQSQAILDYAYTIKDKRLEIEKLKELYKKRLVYFYKHGRKHDIELLLTARSFNQVLAWIRYQKLLAANDRRNFHNILKKTEIIEKNKDVLKNKLLSNRKIIKEKDTEEENYKKRIEERKKLLSQARMNKQLYLTKLNEYEVSAKEIVRLISVEEERRANLEIKGRQQQTDFPQLKGRMIWPTKGRIITGFGKYRHPQLKTITESIGVDIKAKYGDEVNVVGTGIVTAITWQRGRGNIVIINHFGGYYTVYTHLSNIFVKVDDKVNIGQVIGEVGDSGSLKGPILHFEIWQNNEVLNPEKWLG